VFAAIKAAKPTPELLAYQYLQQLPEMAKGEASKVWVVPTDFGSALQGFAKSFGIQSDDGVFRYEAPADDSPAPADDSDIADWFEKATDPVVAQAVAAAEAVARTPIADQPPLSPTRPIEATLPAAGPNETPAGAEEASQDPSTQR